MLTSNDILLLNDFYKRIYCSAFPDEDERESLANITKYLAESVDTAEWKFNVMVAIEKGEIIGGVVYDWFTKDKSLIVEYMVVAEEHRAKGVGRDMFDMLGRLGGKQSDLEWIFCEVDNIEKRAQEGRSAGHLAFWRKMGMKRLEFDYVQPPLSKQQKAVEGLWFIGRNMQNTSTTVPKETLVSTIRNYIKYAMGINPEQNSEFAKMQAEINSKQSDIRLI